MLNQKTLQERMESKNQIAMKLIDLKEILIEITDGNFQLIKKKPKF